MGRAGAPNRWQIALGMKYQGSAALRGSGDAQGKLVDSLYIRIRCCVKRWTDRSGPGATPADLPAGCFAVATPGLATSISTRKSVPESGKVGPVVYLSTRYGEVAKQLTVPHNPRTELQMMTRGKWAFVARKWQSLTDEQQKAWDIRWATNASVGRSSLSSLPSVELHRSGLVQAGQAAAQGGGGGLGAVGGAELLQDHLYVVLDGVLGQVE
jgi:hypothetical protein